MTGNTPIFPLNVVMFPGSELPLRIFETRYLDMVSECLRNSSGFGICLIQHGSEVGKAAETCKTGTYCRITDWGNEAGGLLSISVRGDQRFRIINSSVQPDNLIRAEIEWACDRHCGPVTGKYKRLQEFLRQLHTQFDFQYEVSPENLQDAAWLSYRLADLLPLALGQKQALLEQSDPAMRLDSLMQWIETIQGLTV